VFISVVIAAHNPHAGRLARTVAGLRAQILPPLTWEVVLVDNASRDPSVFTSLDLSWHPRHRIVREEKLGLTAARLRGFSATAGEIIVLVDDDNVLAPDYLALVVAAFSTDAALGAIGGRSLPEFESTPPAWTREFDGLLALRDPGDTPARAIWTASNPREYPGCSPIGAGLALRRSGAEAYVAALARDARRRAFDRTGTQLISGGDNDLVMTVLSTGFAVAYDPALRLKHLIPAARSERAYLGRLNRAIARSWVRVLALHGIRPWRAIHPRTVALRQVRARLRAGFFLSPAAWVRWQGACGHFEGLADHPSDSP
jgi:glycosyltransferase involved in cell wall biosynthesis